MGWLPGSGPTGGNDTFVGTDGVDVANGLGGNDHLSGRGGDDELTDTTGGNDTLLGEDGNDRLFVERSVFAAIGPSTVVLNGGAGDDSLTVMASQSNRPVSATLIGGDGNDRLQMSYAYASGTIDAGAGNDRVVLSGAAAATVTLGPGADVLQITGDLSFYIITDFVAGSSGDQLDFLDWLKDRLQNWDGANPFGSGGFVQLVQSGADTLLQVDLNGGANSFFTMLRFQNTNAASFTAYNVVYNPDGSASAARHIVGDADNNNLSGFDGNDHLEGLRGDDYLSGGAGDDILEGGDGRDQLYGGSGNDLLTGGDGGDSISAGANSLGYGGAGDDTLNAGGGGVGHTQLFGESGNDVFNLSPTTAGQQISAFGGEGSDQFNITSGASAGGMLTANGGNGADYFTLGSIQSAVNLVLGDGRDHIVFSSASSIGAAAIVLDFDAGPGGDYIDLISYLQSALPSWDQQSNPFAAGLVRFVDVSGSAVLQLSIGGVWRDTLVLQNVLSAFVLPENISGLSPLGAPLAPVTTNGGWGGDQIFGWIGPDLIYGSAGNDELRGGNGADQLFGGAGRDSLWGDAGNDILDAGGGSYDEMRGGAGNDTYVYERGYGQLLIYGFEPGVDSFVVRGYTSYTSIEQSGQDVLIRFGDQYDVNEIITLRFFNIANFNPNSITYSPARTVAPMPAISQPTGTQVAATLLEADLSVTAGSSLYTRDSVMFVHQNSGAVTLTNSGTLTGIRDGVAGAGLTQVLYSDRPFTLHNTATGVIRAIAQGDSASAIGFNSVNWAFTVVNDGLIEAISVNGRAAAGAATWFTNSATGVVRVWAGERGIGIGQMLGGGELFYNAGLIEVIGHDSAVAIGGAREWTNTGTIRVSAVDRSIAVGMTGGGTFVNSGLIEGDYSFRYSDEAFSDIYASNQRIENSGQVHGHIFLSAGDDTIVNTGTIVGNIDLSIDADRVENDGTINGLIDLGAGTDVYVGAGEVTGSIFAGEGADQLTGGDHSETIFGGEGDDVVSGGGGDDYIDTGRGNDVASGGAGFDTLSFVTANMRAQVDLLAGTANSSGQDSISGFERVVGSRYGDQIAGAEGAEVLQGEGGDDVLLGRGGADVIDGGAGNDLLSGGGGADQFRFVVGDGDDAITDFSASEGDQINVFGFTAYQSLQQVGADVLLTFAPYNSIRILNTTTSAVASALSMNAAVPIETVPDIPLDISQSEIVLWSEDLHILPGEEINLVGVQIGVHSPTIPFWSQSYNLINEGTFSITGHSNVFGAFVAVENRVGAVFRVELLSPGDGERAIGVSQHDVINDGLFEIISSAAGWGITSTQSVINNGVLRVVSRGGIAVREVSTFVNTGLVEVVGGYVFSGGGQLIDNSGVMRSLPASNGGAAVALRLDYYAGGVHTVHNSGLIEAAVAIQATAETLHLDNSGVIFGRLELAAGDDQIINTGQIADNVDLGGGADLFDGTLAVQNPIVWAGAGNDRVFGGAGNDNFNGVSGDDQLFGNDGSDLLIGEAGNDTLNGGSGVDTARFAVASTAAIWTRNPSGTWTVTAGADGVDTLTGVEVLQFTDRSVVLDNAFRTFSGDGTSDLLWRNANTGAVAVWQMSGATQTNAYIAGGAPADWAILGTGDFNGDGRDDIIWRNSTTTAVAVWADGSGTAASIITGVPGNWQFQGVGDFNFDGRDDFVWRNSNDGAVAVWLMNGNTISSQSIVSAAPAAWSIAGVADFDGDGRDDFLLRNTDGTIARWTTDGVTQTGAAIVGSAPSQWQIQGVGDFDGDGRADILFRNTSDGGLAMWRMDGNTTLGVQMVGGAPLSWGVANIGDYNGDGRDDILWHNTDGTVALWTMNGFIVQNQAIVASVPTEWGLI